MLWTLKENEARGPEAKGREQDKSNNLLFHYSEDDNDNENYEVIMNRRRKPEK